MRRHENERKGTEFLAAQIAAAVINFSTLHPKEMVHVKDLMPSQWKPPARPTQEQIMRSLDMYFNGLRAHRERGGR